MLLRLVECVLGEHVHVVVAGLVRLVHAPQLGFRYIHVQHKYRELDSISRCMHIREGYVRIGTTSMSTSM